MYCPKAFLMNLSDLAFYEFFTREHLLNCDKIKELYKTFAWLNFKWVNLSTFYSKKVHFPFSFTFKYFNFFVDYLDIFASFIVSNYLKVKLYSINCFVTLLTTLKWCPGLPWSTFWIDSASLYYYL